jgi:2-dehydro-3-deoxygalactonokinase
MAGETTSTEWIAVDWGTSNLRVWIIGADGHPFATETSDQGMGTLQNDGFEAALLDLIEPYLVAERAMPVVCCGMVGSRQGWAEAAYLSVPSRPPNGQAATSVSAKDPRIAVSILPGIKQITPPDVMRGEETQIAGFLQGNPDFDGVICLPGTHTKWVHISAQEIVSFQTFMTGEMFALLSKQSVLRHSVGSDGFDQSAFDAAVADAMDRPQLLASKLFGLRAGSLVADLDPLTARSRLSGLLIGAELAGARPYWLGQNVAIIGDSAVAEPYRLGLAAQGVNASTFDVADLTLRGLSAARRSLKECSS